MFYSESIWLIYMPPELRPDVFMSHEASYTMKRSPQPKALDVSAETVSLSNQGLNGGSSAAPGKKVLKATLADEAVFDADDELNFEEELNSESYPGNADGSAMTDNWEDDRADEGDIWADSLEDEWEEDSVTISKEYFEDEFEFASEDDPEFALFAQEVSQGPTISEILQRGMVKALAARNSPDFFEQVVQTLNQAVAGLRPPQGARKLSRHGAKRQPNGHHPGLRRQVLSQPLRSRLRELTFLAQRYGSRGLSEIDLLEDAITLLQETDGKALSPVLAGLAARLAVKPRLGSLDQRLQPALGQKLLRAAERSLSLLAQQGALEALPGLAQTLGQHAIRRRRPLETLPADFYQGAVRLAANPALQKRLAHYKTEQPDVIPIAQTQVPTTWRINGPIEIHIAVAPVKEGQRVKTSTQDSLFDGS